MDSNNQPREQSITKNFYYLKIFIFSIFIIGGIILLATINNICNSKKCTPLIISLSITMIIIGIIGLIYLYKKFIMKCNDFFIKI